MPAATARHIEFVAGLLNSEPAVFAVAAHLHKQGHAVEIPGRRVAPTAAEHVAYTDEADLFILKRDGFVTKRIPVEVKNLSVDFIDSYNFPHRHLYTNKVERVDNEQVPAIYYVVSADRRYAAIIPPGTRWKWYTHTFTPAGATREMTVYCCPKTLASWVIL